MENDYSSTNDDTSQDNTTSDGKICTSCNMTKLLSDFYFINKTNKYTSECKTCRGLRRKEYYLRHADKLKEYSKKYYAINRDRLRREARARYHQKKALNRKVSQDENN